MTERPATSRARWNGLQVGGNGATAHVVTTDLTSILDSVEVPIVVVERDLTMAAFNQAAEDALGLCLPDPTWLRLVRIALFR